MVRLRPLRCVFRCLADTLVGSVLGNVVPGSEKNATVANVGHVGANVSRHGDLRRLEPTPECRP